MNDFSLSALPFKPESLGSSSVKVLTVHEVSVLSSLRWSQFVGGQPQNQKQKSESEKVYCQKCLHILGICLGIRIRCAQS